MQDVICGGGRGVQARSSAEVELVIDNADGGIDLPMGEISILRRLDRNGDGEYRLNGAKCRLVDVLEVLDRKSTRLNSSHANISYAVFCLKKKKKDIGDTVHRQWETL